MMNFCFPIGLIAGMMAFIASNLLIASPQHDKDLIKRPGVDGTSVFHIITFSTLVQLLRCESGTRRGSCAASGGVRAHGGLVASVVGDGFHIPQESARFSCPPDHVFSK